MNILNAFILGVVEGVTEFLPVSSTAHLIAASKFLGIESSQFLKFFEVFIQSGAILAVLLMYSRFFLKDFRLIKNIAVSFIPTSLVGLFLHKIIKEVFFESMFLISGSLFVVGLLFFLVEHLIAKKTIKVNRSIHKMSLTDAFLIGLGQSLAVVPGVSRAGIVILVMMFTGYSRSESALYSFLLAVPTILAASVFDFVKTDPGIIADNSNLSFLMVGFFVSFLFAYISVRWLVNHLRKNSLIGFAWYRILASIALMFFK